MSENLIAARTAVKGAFALAAVDHTAEDADFRVFARATRDARDRLHYVDASSEYRLTNIRRALDSIHTAEVFASRLGEGDAAGMLSDARETLAPVEQALAARVAEKAETVADDVE